MDADDNCDAITAALAGIPIQPSLEIDSVSGVKRLCGRRLDALDAILLAWPHHADQLVKQPLFWGAVHFALRLNDGNRQARKTATLLLREALTLDSNECTGASSVSDQWVIFLALLDGLEDMPLYLFVDLWRKLGDLFTDVDRVDYGTMDAPSTLPIPSLSRSIPFEWTVVLLERAFGHDNPRVARACLAQVLSVTESTLRDEGKSPAKDADSPADSSGDTSPASEAAAGRVAAQTAHGHGPSSSTYSDQQQPILVNGTPYGLLLPAWYVAGCKSAIRVTGTLSSSTPTSDGSRAVTLELPAPSLLAHLGDSTLYRGAEDLFGKALGRYVQAYMEMVGRRRPAIAQACVRSLLRSVPHFTTAGGAVRRFYSALASVDPGAFPGGRLPHALDASGLALVRATLIGLGSAHGRTFFAERQREIVSLLLAWCDPFQVGTAHTPVPDVMHTLASFSCASLAPQPGSGGALLSQWIAQAIAGTSDSLDAKGESSALTHFAEALVTAVAHYLEGRPSRSAVAFTATGIARMLSLLPFDAAAAGGHQAISSATLQRILSPLLDALSCVHRHAYMDSGRRARSFLLLQALLTQAQPGASRLSDVHVARAVGNDIVPDYDTDLRQPLYAEFSAASRASLEALVPELGPWLAANGNPSAPDDDLLPPSSRRSWLATQLGTSLVSLPCVSDDLAPALESAIASGLSAAAVASGWSPAVVTGAGSRPSAAGVPPLTFGFLLSNLRLCIDSETSSSDGSAPYAAAASRLLTQATCILKESILAQPMPVGDHTAAAVAAVRQTNALQLFAVVVTALAPDTGAAVLRIEGADTDSQPDFAQLISLLVSLPFVRPRNSPDTVLPLWHSDAAHSDESPIAPSAVDSASQQPISWASLRTLHEACRYTTLVALLRATQRGLQARLRDGPALDSEVTLMGLPLALSNTVAEACLEALDSCGPAYEAAIMRATGAVLPCCLAQCESPEEYAAGIRALLPPCSSTAVVPVTSTSLDAFLAQLTPMTRDRKTTRRALVAYADALWQPLLFARGALHLAPDASCASGTSGAGKVQVKRKAADSSRKPVSGGQPDGSEDIPAGAAPLRRHVLQQLAFFTSEVRPVHCIQTLTSRLVRCWTSLLRTAAAPSALPDAAAASRSVLGAYAPVMLSLLLHREPLQGWETYPLTDGASRAQLQRWLDRWAAQEHSRGWWGQAVPDYLGDELAALGDGRSVDGSKPSGDAGALAHPPPLPLAPTERGAGTVTRVQLLLWLDLLCDMAAEQRTRALLAGQPLTDESGPAVALQRCLMLRLADLNRTPAWKVDAMPGSPSHGAKLRSWQALTLLAGRWGEVGSAALSGASEWPVPGIDGLVYLPAADAYLWRATPPLAERAPHQAPDAPPAKVKGRDALTPLPLPDRTQPLTDSDAAREVAFLTASEALTVIQLPSARQYMEATLVALARRFPSVVACGYAVPTLRDPALRPQQGTSALLVASDLLHHMAALAAPPADEVSVASAAAVPAWARAQLHRLSRALLFSSLQWLSTPIGVIRTLTQGILLTVAPLLFPAAAALLARPQPPPMPRDFALGDDGNDAGDGGGSAPDPALAGVPPALLALLPQLHQIAQSPDLSGMIAKQLRLLGGLAPSRACSLKGILCSPANEHGELVPLDVYTAVRDAFSAVSFTLHTREPYGTYEAEWLGPRVEWAVNAGILPPGAVHDERLREGLTLRPEPERSAGPDSESPAGGFNFQRKVLSAAAASTGLGAGTAASAVTPSTAAASEPAVGTTSPGASSPAGTTIAASLRARAQDPDAGAAGASGSGSHSTVSALRSSSHPVLTDVAQDGRPCQPLVVLASLVDKVPNLAGLARTCEIFAAESLVVPDGRVATDSQFRDISVSANEWFSLHECKPSAMLQFIRQRRAQGYTIVGLEQAARSVPLGQATLPDRMVLVLGAEREGLPVDVIRELDVVVEVPQMGLIRSLNVHVSGALLVWEYTRQRLARAAAGTPASAAAAAAAVQ